MSYRDGYDFRKWHANAIQQRPRRYWARWAMLGAIGATLILATLQTTAPAHVFPTPALVWLPTLTMGLSPFARESWATERGLAAFDEFERAALVRATARAYFAFLMLVLAMMLWLWAATALDWPHPGTARGWFAWGMALLSVGVCLPATFAEFMVPLPDPEEQPL